MLTAPCHQVIHFAMGLNRIIVILWQSTSQVFWELVETVAENVMGVMACPLNIVVCAILRSGSERNIFFLALAK